MVDLMSFQNKFYLAFFILIQLGITCEGLRSINEVTSPVKNAIVHEEMTQSITWTTDDMEEDWKVEILLKYGDWGIDSTKQTITSSVANSQRTGYSWIPPANLDQGSYYYIHVEQVDNCLLGYCRSRDGDYFTIKPIQRSIKISEPKSSTKLHTSEAFTIKWEHQNAGDFVRIELLEADIWPNPDDLYEVIATQAPNTGSFDWTVKDTDMDNSNEYYVRITSTSYSGARDDSFEFEINNLARGVKVSMSGLGSQATSRSFKEGDTVSVTWNAENIGDNVKIELYDDDWFSDTLYWSVDNTASVQGQNTLQVNLPAAHLPKSSHYYFKVTSNSFTSVRDTSNKFEISPIPHSIEVLEPLEGASYIEGDNMVIKWNSENAGPQIKLNIYMDGWIYNTKYGSCSDSAPNVEGQNTFTCVVPHLQESNHYYIQAESILINDLISYSKSFTIKPLPHTLKINKPVGGESIKEGDVLSVKWDGENFGSLGTLLLMDDDWFTDSVYLTVDDVDLTLKSASLNIPSHGLPHSKHYYIMIKNKGESYELESRSNKFEISPVPHSIQINKPAGGESFQEGDDIEVDWVSENPGTTGKIDLMLDGWFTDSIIDSLDDVMLKNGTASLSISQRSEFSRSTHYYIQITSNSDAMITDNSKKIAINPLPHQLNVNTPTTGARFFSGDVIQVSWESINAGSHVSIELFTNNWGRDTKYAILAESAVNSANGNFSWVVPDITSGLKHSKHYYLYLQSTSLDNVNIYSNEFEIIPLAISIPPTPSPGTNTSSSEVTTTTTTAPLAPNPPKEGNEFRCTCICYAHIYQIWEHPESKQPQCFRSYQYCNDDNKICKTITETKSCCLVSIPGSANASKPADRGIFPPSNITDDSSDGSFLESVGIPYRDKSFIIGIVVGVGVILLVEIIIYWCKKRVDAFKGDLRGFQASFKGARKLNEGEDGEIIEMTNNPMLGQRKPTAAAAAPPPPPPKKTKQKKRKKKKGYQRQLDTVDTEENYEDFYSKHFNKV